MVPTLVENSEFCVLVCNKSTPFAVNKDEWDTKEDTGKSMKKALYIQWHAVSG